MTNAEIDNISPSKETLMRGNESRFQAYPARLAGFIAEKLAAKNILELNLIGTDSIEALGFLLAQPRVREHSEQPNLVIMPAEEDCSEFIEALSFFDPNLESILLPAFDVGLYSNLYPNRKIVAQRLHWLHRAHHAQSGEIFVTTLPALAQRTLSFQELEKHSFTLRVGDKLPASFSERLIEIGYVQAPVVEDFGQFAIRGGILDLYSPAQKDPLRIELFGDSIDSIRSFDAETQRSAINLSSADVIPAVEALLNEERRLTAVEYYKKTLEGREVDPAETQAIIHSLAQGQIFHGMEFLIKGMVESPQMPLEHFSQGLSVWSPDPLEVARVFDEFHSELVFEHEQSPTIPIRVPHQDVFGNFEEIIYPEDSVKINLSNIRIEDHAHKEGDQEEVLSFRADHLLEFKKQAAAFSARPQELSDFLSDNFKKWKASGYKIFVTAGTQSQAQRLALLLEKTDYHAGIVNPDDYDWAHLFQEQEINSEQIHVLSRTLGKSLRLQDEMVIFLRDEDFFGSKRRARKHKDTGTLENRANILSFGDLKVGDFVVHKEHGIGIYQGLEVMPIQGAEAEFIQIQYKGRDKLYLPVYRVGQIQKYSGPTSQALVDKLGGTGWTKTKTKVKKHLRDLAGQLLDLYAKRAQAKKLPFSAPGEEYLSFEGRFPYEETPDQARAIEDVISDMASDKPMDRLVCGDVGFGKTEVAMRAAFKAAEDGKQVAIIAPTTILALQHLENFQKRFKDWPVVIRGFNRFISKPEIKKSIEGLKEGKVNIAIGTHRLLSKDIVFKDLGLLIIDEEQKFGVKHKEKIRQLKINVDTLAMSATPIPRTLNLSLMGVRDLSIINTPPVDRLPTRTFVCRFDKDTIHKACMSEIKRGGQIFFIHNRVNSIYALEEELREILPDVRIKVAHGQMEEKSLENTILQFFHHEIDMLICTTIIESGMDIPKANTMFIDNSHTFGLSQLYQLRGRVGRSKDRAYCYLLIPNHKRLDKDAQQRLKVIQENTALGSGIRVAHYDLELRGAGDMLGQEQSGHINAVGYELYLELLEDVVHELKGEPSRANEIEPEINVPIPALIPDFYIKDLKVRLAYYKALSEIDGPEDLDRIEDELRDQFGKLPKEVLNLMGLMLIRKTCKSLGVRDLSCGKKTVSLMFTDQTPLSPQRIIELTARENKKYAFTPNGRLNIRMNEIGWPRIYDELAYLAGLV